MNPLPLFGPLMTLAWPFIKGRLAKRHETGLEERHGYYSAEKLFLMGSGRNFWLHAVSVGEVQAASSFADAVQASNRQGRIVLSTVTATGCKAASIVMKDSVSAHIYAPWDVPAIVRRACDAVCPVCYATVETEIWPNILMEMKRREVPRLLLNARVSDRAWGRTAPVRAVMREMYRLFDMVFARSERDAERLLSLGVEPSRLEVAGDLKIDAILKRRDGASKKSDELRTMLLGNEGLKIFVAGSTHDGEDEIILEAFGKLVEPARSEKSILAIAPRHPERAGSVAELAAGLGFKTVLFSKLKESPSSFFGAEGLAQVVVIDEIGVLYELYGASDGAFIGGSLVPKGGQNILEPASWGIPVLHGPYMDDFADAVRELDSCGSAFEVRTSDDILECWSGGGASRGETDGREYEPGSYFIRNAGAASRVWRSTERFLQ